MCIMIKISDATRSNSANCKFISSIHVFFIFQTEILDEDKRLIAALDCYFLEENGKRFKVSVPFKPYLYVLASAGTEQETISYLLRKYQGYLSACETVMKEDLDLLNHLTGLKQQYIKCTFLNTADLQKVRRLGCLSVAD